MGIKSFIGKLLHFFGIQVFRVDITKFYEIEEEISHIHATASSDINLFIQEAFTLNIIENVKALTREYRKKMIEYMQPELKKTAEDILKIVESSIIPFLKAHIGVKSIHKEASRQLEKDCTLVLDLYEKFKEDWEEYS